MEKSDNLPHFWLCRRFLYFTYLCHLRLGLPNCIFPSCFATNILDAFLISSWLLKNLIFEIIVSILCIIHLFSSLEMTKCGSRWCEPGFIIRESRQEWIVCPVTGDSSLSFDRRPFIQGAKWTQLLYHNGSALCQSDHQGKWTPHLDRTGKPDHVFSGHAIIACDEQTRGSRNMTSTFFKWL